MIFGFYRAMLLTWLLAPFFIVNGVVNRYGLKPMRECARLSHATSDESGLSSAEMSWLGSRIPWR
jgi:hypothetical protein